MADDAGYYLEQIVAKVRFLSLEPLLEPMHLHFGNQPGRKLDWVIIGAQTPYSAKTAPPMEWVQEILVAANNAGIPVFMKNNLRPVLDNTEIPGWTGFELRQEWPNADRGD